MQSGLPLPQDKKLTVLFRVEPGCLGPNGIKHIEDFCLHAQSVISEIDADFVHWLIVPRYDKTLAETQFKLRDKTLTHNQAARYLASFTKDLDEFEGHLHDALMRLIAEYPKE